MEKMSDILKEFEERTKNAINDTTRKKWESDKELDDLYNFDIHIWRTTGMGSSLQAISGNPISIMTGIASLLTTLIDKGVMNENDLDYMVKMVKDHIKMEKQ